MAGKVSKESSVFQLHRSNHTKHLICISSCHNCVYKCISLHIDIQEPWPYGNTAKCLSCQFGSRKVVPLLRIFCEHLFESVLIRMFGMQCTANLASPLWSAAIWQRAALACACWWEQRYNVFCQHVLIIKRASVGYGIGRCHFSS